MINIRKGVKKDKKTMQELLVDTIHEICKLDYNQQQRDVWAAGVENKERWDNVFIQQEIWVAELQKVMVGFCTLKDQNYIDFFYVHKDYQRQGVAKILFEELESHAISKKQAHLISDVSITAKSFFENLGFVEVKKQTIIKDGIELTNSKMKKVLLSSTSSS